MQTNMFSAAFVHKPHFGAAIQVNHARENKTAIHSVSKGNMPGPAIISSDIVRFDWSNGRLSCGREDHVDPVLIDREKDIKAAYQISRALNRGGITVVVVGETDKAYFFSDGQRRTVNAALELNSELDNFTDTVPHLAEAFERKKVNIRELCELLVQQPLDHAPPSRHLTKPTSFVEI